MSAAPATRGAAVWIALALFLAGVLLGRAWSDGVDSEAPRSYLEQLADSLDLSPAQVAQVEALLADEDRAVQQLVERARADLAGPVADHRQRTEDSLRAILEPDQLERYDELVQR